ncbi:SPOR domain-containing protein [Salipiger sp. PrR002]|uniref:SPOR domain-containing protein n=1 Tax=Salipiger sp. PrR002 TaxID=2706489 RepID=UPI0013B7A03C|nr:SPOR domain-containing protein [Salipiger sp. PrR002]NDW00784.1 SPOR domain-containing protein [Salipiger sp. PrR002]
MRFKVLANILAGPATLALGALSAAPALAQRIDTISEPAEVPPASYEAAQYVDSKGCVFVRAGFDDAVIWVPRVSRAGDPVCGYAPSLGASARTATRTVEAPAAQPAPKPAPVTKPAAQPVATAAAPAAVSAPAPTRTTTRTTSAQPMATVASKPASAPAPVVKAPASKPPAAPAPRVVATVPAPSRAPAPVAPGSKLVGGACPPGFSGEITSNGRRVRCGPQSAPYVTEVRRGEAPGPGKNVYYNHGGGRGSWEEGALMVPGSTRIVPRHVYEEGPAERTVLPAGYRPAWEDDRLNPHRALQTVEGYYDSQRIWTQTVPRASTAGTRVTARAPRVRFEGDPDLILVQAPRNSGATTLTAAASDSASATAASPKFVEIGAFTTGDKAAEARRRLQAAGLPVQMLQRGSDEMRRLRVGPYSDARAASRALAQVQATGYREAYLR